MTTTLSEGVKVPDVGSVNWAGDLEINWNLLNGALANLSGNVKLDRDNIWTGEQSFTLPIVGSITGTASKAIADEDGTSIKTGYVNVAGNQTVSGQKTWSGNQFFTSPMYPKNTSYEIGNTPASNVAIPIYFTDKNDVYTGYVRSVIYTSGRSATEIRAKNAFKNGVLDPTGSDISSNLNVEVQPNGAKTIYWDGLIRNDVTPFTTNNNSLGSSTNQWSSVYAQTYYYNGTAWGLDKENVWTRNNTFTASTITLKNTALEQGVVPPSGNSNNLTFVDKNGDTLCYLRNKVNTDGETYIHLYANNKYKDGQLDPTGTNVVSQFYVGITKTGVPYVVPRADTYPDINNAFNLGTSTNKWKTFNGINPGALGLPSSSYVEIDTTNWDKTGATSQSYTPTVHGWLYISIQNIAGNYLSMSGGRGAISMDGTGVQSGLRAMLPVIANESVSITVKTGSIFAARFYPCLGNV